MKKVKSFLQTLRASALPHYPYYHTLLREPFVKSLGYFLTFSLVLYFLFLALFISRILLTVSVSQVVDNFSQSLQSFPSDLKIHLRQGTLTTNYDRPYFMWMNYQGSKLLLFVIDPAASADKVTTYKPIAFLTGKTISIRDLSNTGNYNTSFYGNTTADIDKSQVDELSLNLHTLVSWFFVIAPILLVLVLPVLVIITNLGYIIVTSLIVYLLGKFAYATLTFQKTLQLGLHAITIPLIVNYILSLWNVQLATFPMNFFLLLFLFVSVAVYEAHWKR